MSDQPKPTDEWTADDFYDLGFEEATEKAKAINAALAAEEERVTREIFDAFCDDPTEGAMRAKEKEIQQLRAERSKVQALVDALKEIAHDETIGSYKACNIARDALARVKEGT